MNAGPASRCGSIAVVVGLAPAFLAYAFSIVLALIDALPAIRSASLWSVPIAVVLFLACRRRQRRKPAVPQGQSSGSK